MTRSEVLPKPRSVALGFLLIAKSYLQALVRTLEELPYSSRRNADALSAGGPSVYSTSGGKYEPAYC